MIKLNEDVAKKISKVAYYNEADFIKDARAYIKAVASGRMLYAVTHVSSSGMSRDINIKSFEGKITQGYFRNYYRMLNVLNYKFNKNTNDVRVGGCGMNMLFSTNYNIIHDLQGMGFINKKRCAVLEQEIN